MLKKLLHYDLKSVFRYWWIAALASIGLSVAGGLAISVTVTDKDVPLIISVLVVLAIVFTIIGIVAFPIFSYIMIFVRFYKNFFTDEGYLTFTLPVKRSQLLNSKIMTSVITTISSATVIFLDIIILCAIGAGKPFYQDFLMPLAQELSELFAQISSLDYVYMFLIIIELLLLMILGYAFFTLLMFACITFATIITKKAKVVTAIGIYYVANGVITTIVQLIFLFGTTYLTERISALPDDFVNPLIVMILLAVVLMVALICMVLYMLNYFMIDRKLNLA